MYREKKQGRCFYRRRKREREREKESEWHLVILSFSLIYTVKGGVHT